MGSVPGADRGPRAGSPRGVVDAIGLPFANSNDAAANNRFRTHCVCTWSLPLSVVTSYLKLRHYRELHYFRGGSMLWYSASGSKPELYELIRGECR